ncbi:pilus (MSHA type) biogenesis protein MshL [Ideonella sp. 4Y16]|uniref:Pilus (MSHA type) biogenesis protein MshL n=1 Tax=Ideonella alba TaxID=2824118 RepID=A0A940Y7V8_9BURK|nr:pilus (MSHA type) biogenesis protein MshL [Ideonella alba]MBQ0931507.1 pilus (MSHA type) biogenesis protein MshL [Ideonella alba]MBQ0943812.1 pilus (MSHA type) biogenesis protein MshL [Ideonella alba]
MNVRPLLLAVGLAWTTLASAAPLPAPLSAAAAETGDGPRFDVAMNNAPASAVFAQLAVGSRYNMLVSPEVTGTVSLSLKDTTLMEALAALRDLYGYDFKVQGNRITVYSNTVQTRLFRINYLPGRRQGASDIRVSSSSITQAGTGGSAAAAAGAGGSTTSGGTVGGRAEDSAHVRTTSDADFWREVQSSLNALVGTAADRRVVLNPAAGVVVVRASPAELRQVEQYLGAVQINIERQVMIEAKIVDVVLGQESQQGINWSSFGKFLGKGKLSVGMLQPGATIGNTGDLVDGSGNLATPGSALMANALGGGMYGIAFQAGTFAAMLNFLQTQGDVQVLSSPRIATLNNQKAVLKVGTDELYVTGVASTSTSTATSSSSTPTVTLQPFFSGIALDVTPQIDERGNVMLHVHPSISVVSERQKNVDLGSLGSYKLPLATSAVNETDSIVRVADGQIVAIGGLMTQSQTLDKSGLPVLGDMPLVGKLFSQKNAVSRKRELVILMKPTVIQDGRWPESAEDARARQVIQLEAPAR